MQPFSRKIKALVLLVVILAPLSYGCISEIRQELIRAEMREKLEKESLEKLVIHTGDIRWYEHGREIMVHDRLFDVWDIRTLGNGLLELTGLFDEEETRLVRQMEESREQENQPSGVLASLFQAMTGADMPADFMSHDGLPASLVIHAGFYDTRLPEMFRGMRTPPPQPGLQIS